MKGSQFIENGMSWQGGWSRLQLKLIGVPWPPYEGWRRDAERREFDESIANDFVALRNAHLFLLI